MAAVLVVAVALIATGVRLSAAGKEEKRVEFCDILKSPELFNKKSIVTEGVLLPGEHSVAFYNPHCMPSESNKVNTQGVLENSARPEALVRKVQRLFRKQAPAKIEAAGVFYSDGGPFGPDVARFRFVIQRLKSVQKQ
ncbi:MAG: hypothetical protein WA324_05705 [Bryobacteraceae bacterium]